MFTTELSNNFAANSDVWPQDIDIMLLDLWQIWALNCYYNNNVTHTHACNKQTTATQCNNSVLTSPDMFFWISTAVPVAIKQSRDRVTSINSQDKVCLKLTCSVGLDNNGYMFLIWQIIFLYPTSNPRDDADSGLNCSPLGFPRSGHCPTKVETLSWSQWVIRLRMRMSHLFDVSIQSWSRLELHHICLVVCILMWAFVELMMMMVALQAFFAQVRGVLGSFF